MSAGFITQFFETLASIVTAFIGIVIDLFVSIGSIFYESGEGFTIFGAILLISIAVPLVMWGVRFVIQLVRSIRLRG